MARATSERASARSAEHSHPGYAPAPGAGGGRQGGVLTVAMGYRYPHGAVIGADPELPVVPERMRLTGDRAPGPRTCGCTPPVSAARPWICTSSRSCC